MLSSFDGPALNTGSLSAWYVRGRLHRADGPAVISPFDGPGDGHYYWRGVRVPRWVIMDVRSRTPDEILKIPNAEVRRAAMESWGLEDFLIDLGRLGVATIIHQELPPRPHRRLWRLSVIDTDGANPVYVEVVCPSTGRHYFLRVFPEAKTCHEAVASTFLMSASEYNPESES